MLSQASVLAILAFAGSALAAPQPTQAVQARGVSFIDRAKPGLAVNGAIDLAYKNEGHGPAPTPAPTAKPEKRALPHMTISVYNAFPHPISTNHNLARSANNQPYPAPIAGNQGGGVLQPGQGDSIVVPQGWAGNIPLVEFGGGRQIVGDESKIEASYVWQDVFNDFTFDINISYVDGFSLPITCSCDVGPVGGCNKYLWDLGHCDNDNGVGSCRNPQRNGGTYALPFFAPCQHAAYAYAYDDSANTGNGRCHNDLVTCCVGTNCPGGPNQS